MPKRTALASIEWADGRAVIKDIICPADDDVIVKAIEQAGKTRDRLPARLASRVHRLRRRPPRWPCQHPQGQQRSWLAP